MTRYFLDHQTNIQGKKLKASTTNRLTFITLAVTFLVSGCATPHVVQPTKPTDSMMSCSQLELEMSEADRFRAEAQKEKGMTGTNVVAAIFFWPAMIGTYSNANDAIAAADLRKTNLANLHAQKKCGGASAIAGASTAGAAATEESAPARRLADLKALLDKGLITQAEHDEKRKKILGEI